MQPIIVIAASAGSLDPLKQIVSALPVPCSASVFIVPHVGGNQNILPALLAEMTALSVVFAEDDTPVEVGHIYVAPPGYHMRLEAERIRLDQGQKVNHTRPAADPLFLSAAETYHERVVGIVLSGYGEDGAVGLRVIKERGGLALVQDLDEAKVPGMPYAALYEDHPDAFLTAEKIGTRIAALCG
ncbi:chemotaxis protein CheB [Methylobacterium soli]|uniref:protein-glutamate methylesterase n=1 Tax=Methylobacterium soli TaxID=553447 RepID=A0A6L3SPD3_9HYPH|nr:chemotaxis protein CheB [Methylobacterium soli]KAB1071124.1 chemotaxis protein CheB [Methylobacterium soli]GJE43143.1 Protein-glutamate methylesterase/protein-glutamine glutaminase [Methylobacterium soli]